MEGPHESCHFQRTCSSLRLRVGRLSCVIPSTAATVLQTSYNLRMGEFEKTESGALTLCVALRHLGTEREIVVLKVDGNNFYAFPPYAKKPLGDVDGHMSWHASGERHAVFRIRRGGGWEKDKRMQKKSVVKMPPPPLLKGVAALYHSSIVYSRFHELLPVGTNEGTSVVLNAERAHFRDDFTVIRAYLVEPGADACIPISPDTGPRILHLVKQTTPWMAVEVYQQN
jgi:hypothetical protein